MKASRWETVGAWLRLWTPPRDVEVPPFPARRAVIAAAIALAVAVPVVVLVAGSVGEGKEEGAAREQREADARRAAERRRLTVEQRPRFGGTRARDRAAVLRALEAAITRDVQARRRAGELDGSPARTTRCAPYPATAERAEAERAGTLRRAGYDCTAVQRGITSTDERGRTARGSLGYPFLAVVDYARGRWAFCKVAPIPGERVVPDPEDAVEVPRACRPPG
jgi:hypothetical protein